MSNWNSHNIEGRRMQGGIQKILEYKIFTHAEWTEGNKSVSVFKEMIQKKLDEFFIEKKKIDDEFTKITNMTRELRKLRRKNSVDAEGNAVETKDHQGDEASSIESLLKKIKDLRSAHEKTIENAFKSLNVESMRQLKKNAKTLMNVQIIFNDMELFESSTGVDWSVIPMNAFAVNPSIAISTFKKQADLRKKQNQTALKNQTALQKQDLQIPKPFDHSGFQEAAQAERSDLNKGQESITQQMGENKTSIDDLNTTVASISAMQGLMLEEIRNNGMGIGKNLEEIKKSGDKLSEAKDAIKGMHADIKQGFAALTGALKKCSKKERVKSYAAWLACVLSIFLALMGVFFTITKLFFRLAQLSVGLSKTAGRVGLGWIPIIGPPAVELIGLVTIVIFFLLYAKLVSHATGGIINGRYIAGEMLAGIKYVLLFLCHKIKNIVDSLYDDMDYLGNRLGIDEIPGQVKNATQEAVNNVITDLQTQLFESVDSEMKQTLFVENADGVRTWFGDVMMAPVIGVNYAADGANALWNYATSQETIGIPPPLEQSSDPATPFNPEQSSDPAPSGLGGGYTASGGEKNEDILDMCFGIIDKMSNFAEKFADALEITDNGVNIKVKNKLENGKWVPDSEKTISLEALSLEVENLKNNSEGKQKWINSAEPLEKVFLQKEVDFQNLLKHLTSLLYNYDFVRETSGEETVGIFKPKTQVSQKDEVIVIGKFSNYAMNRGPVVSPLESMFKSICGQVKQIKPSENPLYTYDGIISHVITKMHDTTKSLEASTQKKIKSIQKPKMGPLVKTKKMVMGGKKSKRRLKKKKKKTKRKSRKKRKKSKKRKKKKRKTKKC